MTPGSFHTSYGSLDRALRPVHEPWARGGQEETEAIRRPPQRSRWMGESRPCVWFPVWGTVQWTAKPTGQNDEAHLVPEDPTLANCPRGTGVSVAGPPTRHNVGMKSQVDMSHRGVVGHS